MRSPRSTPAATTIPSTEPTTGFDAIFENPQFAGADTSYWIRQAVPLIGGGVVQLSGRNGVLAVLRSSKEQGQSNFTNPGPHPARRRRRLRRPAELRLSVNANYLWFDDTEVLEVVRQQDDIDRAIGLDLSAALIWRPFMTQNIVFRLSGATLLPGQGLQGSVRHRRRLLLLGFGNLVLTY